MHDLGLKTSVQTFDAFVRCTLMGNQPWPQFQNGIRERSIMDLQHAVLSICSLPLKYKSLKHQQNKVIALANLIFFNVNPRETAKERLQ